MQRWAEDNFLIVICSNKSGFQPVKEDKHLKEEEEERIFIMEIRFPTEARYPKVEI